MVEPAGGFGRDTTRAVQRTPVDRSAVDERATQPGEHLGGVLGNRRKNGLKAHDGSPFRPSSVNSTILCAVAVAIAFGRTIAIPIWSPGPSATPRHRWRRDPGRDDTRTRR